MLASNICGYKVRAMNESPQKSEERELYPEIGERLVIIRKSTGWEAEEFARRVGIGYKAWNNYENGYSIPWQSAMKVVKVLPWITTAYIYQGLSTPEMARSLGLLPPEKEPRSG